MDLRVASRGLKPVARGVGAYGSNPTVVLNVQATEVDWIVDDTNSAQ